MAAILSRPQCKSDGLMPKQPQTITKTNAGLLLMVPSEQFSVTFASKYNNLTY